MAYKRKRSYGRPYARKRRRMGRKFRRVPRGVRTGRNAMFKRCYQLDDIVWSGSGGFQPLEWSHAFKLNEIPNYEEFVNLFDRYRMNKIKIQFVPNFSQWDVSNNPGGNQIAGAAYGGFGPHQLLGMPNIHTAIDYDDSNLGTGTWLDKLNFLRQHRTYKWTRGNRVHSRYFTPAIATGQYDGNTNLVPSGIKFKQWVDTAESDVRHFGIKLIGDYGPTFWDGDNLILNAAIRMRVYVTAYIECADPR